MDDVRCVDCRNRSDCEYVRLVKEFKNQEKQKERLEKLRSCDLFALDYKKI